MDIFSTFSIKEIIWNNKCNMRFLYKLVLKQYIDKKLNGISTSTILENTIKQLRKKQDFSVG